MVEISKWLHNALIADLVEGESDPVELERLIYRRMKDQHEVTEHLARQLGFRTTSIGGVHDTLWMLVSELELLLEQWPLPESGQSADFLAEQACKNLPDVEVYLTLLAGPAKWRRSTLGGDCTIDSLAARLRPVLEREFRSSLNHMLAQWSKWDVPKLFRRWQEERQHREQAEWEARRASVVALTPEERRQRRDDAAKLRGGYYEPPGRTT